jgi:putative spermidine/putrescine transport system permease protein
VTRSRDAGLAGAGGGIAAPGAGARLSLGGTGSGSLRHAGQYLGVAPFLAYVAVFLFWPTYLVVAGAFQNDAGHATLKNVSTVASTGAYLDAFKGSLELSAGTALAGAVLGGLLAWAVAEGDPNGLLRRLVLSMSGVLAQFGGVMLAFAFLATYGYSGLFTLVLQHAFGVNTLASGGWIYGLFGLGVVYAFFQIPLMVLIFLPALDGLQPQWREASDNLGGGFWAYWRYVAGPILAPSFISGLLLLFVNAFSAYATAAALISQGSPIVPLQIRTFLQSEIVLGQAGIGKALAFGMVVVVIIVMSLYALLQRRTAKWRAQ